MTCELYEMIDVLFPELNVLKRFPLMRRRELLAGVSEFLTVFGNDAVFSVWRSRCRDSCW